MADIEGSGTLMVRQYVDDVVRTSSPSQSSPTLGPSSCVTHHRSGTHSSSGSAAGSTNSSFFGADAHFAAGITYHTSDALHILFCPFHTSPFLFLFISIITLSPLSFLLHSIPFFTFSVPIIRCPHLLIIISSLSLFSLSYVMRLYFCSSLTSTSSFLYFTIIDISTFPLQRF